MIDEKLEGWAIVVTNGVRLIGRVNRTAQQDRDSIDDLPMMLSPVYEMAPKAVLVQTSPSVPPSLFANGFTIVAALGYDSVERVVVPAGALVLPCSDLSDSDRANLAKAIDGWETMRRQARSDLLIAPASAARLAKLPLPPRRSS